MVSPDFRYAFDGIEREEVVIATYSMELDRDDAVIAKVRRLSNFVYPGTSADVTQQYPGSMEKHTAHILGIYEVPQYEFRVPQQVQKRNVIVQLAVPLIDLGNSLPTFLSTVAGEILSFGDVRLLDLYIPPTYASRYGGPKFGVDGIRELLGVHDRPLLLGIFKPSQGYSAEKGASVFFEAAAGGADIVKDEELLSDPSYCRRSKRVELYAKAEKQAFEETGEHTLYAVNITDQVDRLLSNAIEAIELGANALMINYVQVGLDATRMVCEDPRVMIPVLGHNAGSAAFVGGSNSGISTILVNAKLPRLCGVDLCILLSGKGSYPALPERCLLLARGMLSPFYDIRPTLPVVANGITPGTVEMFYSQYGRDIALAAGSCIFGHPDGPRIGATAFRQAIEAAVAGRDLDRAAEEHQELRGALELWGKGD